VKPYYQDKQVTLYHGDCLENTQWLLADVLVTDPPYGISSGKRTFEKRSGRVERPDRQIVGDDSTDVRDAALASWRNKPALCFGALNAPYPEHWSRMLVFEKPSLSCGFVGNKKPWLRNWEPVFVRGDWPATIPKRSSVIRTNAAAVGGYNGYSTRAGHPHAKPIDVMEQLVSDCPPGVIADPFAGAGSTLIAARNLGRNAIGVEIEERYCEIIAKRLDQQCFDFGEGA
jgi:DNA modification methylase